MQQDTVGMAVDVATIPRRRFARRRLVTAREGTPVKLELASGGNLVGLLAYVTPDEVGVETCGGLCAVSAAKVAFISPVP